MGSSVKFNSVVSHRSLTQIFVSLISLTEDCERLREKLDYIVHKCLPAHCLLPLLSPIRFVLLDTVATDHLWSLLSI